MVLWAQSCTVGLTCLQGGACDFHVSFIVGFYVQQSVFVFVFIYVCKYILMLDGGMGLLWTENIPLSHIFCDPAASIPTAI